MMQLRRSADLIARFRESRGRDASSYSALIPRLTITFRCPSSLTTQTPIEKPIAAAPFTTRSAPSPCKPLRAPAASSPYRSESRSAARSSGHVKNVFQVVLDAHEHCAVSTPIIIRHVGRFRGGGCVHCRPIFSIKITKRIC